MMKIKGVFKSGQVWIDGKELFPEKSLQVRNHSPSGFNWGYAGSGPAQLALAILLEVIPREYAERLYQDFKFEFVARLPQGDFEREINLEAWISEKAPEGIPEGLPLYELQPENARAENAEPEPVVSSERAEFRFIHPDIDFVLDHRGIHGTESFCRVRLYRNEAADVVVLTEPADNEGGSVTNCIEAIAGIVAEQHGLDPVRTLWIEHYTQTEGSRKKYPRSEETFDLCSMGYDPTKELYRNPKYGNRVEITPFFDPDWKPLESKKALEIILTGKI